MKCCLAKNKEAPCVLKVWICFLMFICGLIVTPPVLVILFLFYIQVVAFVYVPLFCKYICLCTCFFACAGYCKNEKKAAKTNEKNARIVLGWSIAGGSNSDSD